MPLSTFSWEVVGYGLPWGGGRTFSDWLPFSSVQLPSRVRLFATPWTAARQASLSITNSQSLLKLMSIMSVTYSTPAMYQAPTAAAAAAAAKSLQSCLTLCDPIDGSPPGSPVLGILQERTLEWIAISFSNAWKWKSSLNLCDTKWNYSHFIDGDIRCQSNALK